MDRIKILFLAANPNEQLRLQLDEEFRAVTQKIRASEYRDSLELVSMWAVRADDLLQSLNEHKPQIIHFSGHGNSKGEILLVDSDGNSKPVTPQAITALFTTLKDNIRIVILNACYSKVQAKAITKVIDCAIGMNTAIGDQTAITFAASFYRAVGFGRSVQAAFDQGKASLMLEGIPGVKIPTLLVREGVDPNQIVLITDQTDKDEQRRTDVQLSLQGITRENGQYVSLKVHNNHSQKSVFGTSFLLKVFWQKDKDYYEKAHWIDITSKIGDDERYLSWHLGSAQPEVEILPNKEKFVNIAKFDKGLIVFTLFSGDKTHWAGKFRVWIDVMLRLDKNTTQYVTQSYRGCIDTNESQRKGYIYELKIWECEDEDCWELDK